MAVLYADAFFLAGEQRHKAGHVPSPVRARQQDRQANGWGFVLVIDGKVLYDYGQVRQDLLTALVSRKAFIYGLEIAAQIVALTAFCHELPTHWLAFIDNTAGQFALHKGYGKDTAVNGMLAAFWTLAARKSWRPTFERVTSKANTADAVSRADLTRAAKEGWRRVHTPADRILTVMAWAAQDIHYACTRAADDLEAVAGGW